jgi:hypothetical protein
LIGAQNFKNATILAWFTFIIVWKFLKNKILQLYVPKNKLILQFYVPKK